MSFSRNMRHSSPFSPRLTFEERAALEQSAGTQPLGHISAPSSSAAKKSRVENAHAQKNH